jgi:biotin transport system substrate-specific component
MTTWTTYADVLRPSKKQRALAYDAALIVGGSLFIALCSQFAVHIGPVPITGQTLAVLLTGMLLGSRRGTLSVLTYLAEGFVGLPVFSPGGPMGLARLMGPTGGYLVGFAAAAYVVGRLAEQGWDRKATTTFAAMLIGNGVIYAFGLSWLALLVGVDRALPLGLYPFVAGDILKAALATTLLPTGWRLLNR